MFGRLEEIYKIISDNLYFITKKFDGVNNYLFEKWGIKVNVGGIILVIVFVLFIALFVKLILGIVWRLLSE